MRRVLCLTMAACLLLSAPAGATLYEVSGRADGAMPSSKHPRAATDVHLKAQLLTALPDGSLAAVTGWIGSLVGIDVNGIAAPMKGARHLVEDPADIVAAPGGGVLVSNEEVVQRVAPDGSRSTVVARECAGEVCSTPWGLAPRGDGSLLVADTFNDRVRLVAPDGTVSTVLGAPLHWPFALGLLPDGGFMVAEGKPGHGAVDAPLHVWRVAPGRGATAVAGGGAAAAPVACGGTAHTPLELDLRHMIDAVTRPDGSIVVADGVAGLFAIDPDGSARILACPAPAPPMQGADIQPAGFELVQVRMRVRHLAVAPDGTLYVVDGRGRVYADLGDGASRFGVAIERSTLFEAARGAVVVRTNRPADVVVRDGRRVLRRASVPAGSSRLVIHRLPDGIRRLRVEAGAGPAVATHELRVIGRPRLPPALAKRVLARQLRAHAPLGSTVRLTRCARLVLRLRCSARESDGVRSRRGRAAIGLRGDGELEITRGRRRWLADLG
jgi:hypothetical protein